MLNKDYKDMLSALEAEGVEFILIGAYAMAAHGYPRATLDIDLWVLPSVENAKKIVRALHRFGAPTDNINENDFVQDDVVFQIGVAPRRIDILTSTTGLNYQDAAQRAATVVIDGVQVKILSIPDLILNKEKTGRLKDKSDVEELKKLSPSSN